MQRALLRCGRSSGVRLVCVEGNIASGKTAVIQYLSRWLDTVEEPIKRWNNLGGYNALQLLYDDPRRWGTTFQSYVQLTMLQAHIAARTTASRGSGCVMERSIFSARYCFVENLRRRDLLHPADYALLDQWFQWIVENCKVQPDLYVYLKAEPTVSLDRIKKRSRTEESLVQLEYLRSLDVLHNEWLLEKRFPVGADVEVVDANRSIVDVLEQCRLALSRHDIDLPIGDTPLCEDTVSRKMIGLATV